MASARRWIAVATLAVYAGLELYNAVVAEGWYSFCFAVFTAGIGVATLGVARRAFWARWMALGIAATGLLSTLPFVTRPSWALVLFLMLPATLLVTLLGRRMAAHFSSGMPPLWQSGDWRVRALALAIMAAVPTAAGLLVHAGAHAWWIDPSERVVAVAAAALFAGGALAALMQRTVGLLVMFASGCAALGLATESFFRLARPHFGACGFYRLAFDRALIEMTLTTFVPGAVAALAVTVLFAPAMGRFFRDDRRS
jgi:hypothetical protein